MAKKRYTKDLMKGENDPWRSPRPSGWRGVVRQKLSETGELKEGKRKWVKGGQTT